MAQDEVKRNINNANNSKAVQAAANMAANSGNPYAVAAGKGIKIADKLTDGKASEKLGKALTAANKAAGLKGKMAQKAINKAGESGTTDRLNKATAKKNDPMSNIKPKMGAVAGVTSKNKGDGVDNSSKTDVKNEASDGGGTTNFVKDFKILIIGLKVAPFALLFIIFIAIIVSSSQVVVKSIGLDSADSISSKKGEEKISKTKEEEYTEEVKEDEVSYDIFIEDNKFRDSKFENMNLVKIANTTYVERKYGISSINDLEDFYPGLKKYNTSDEESTNIAYDFYYKMYLLYKTYRDNYNTSDGDNLILDLPLLMATLNLQSEDMSIVFSSNLSELDTTKKVRTSRLNEFKYDYDWSSYTLTRDSSVHDMEVLAQHMVSKNENSNTYEIDRTKYKEYLKEFIKQKYYQGKDEYNTAVLSDIREIYDSKQQYEDLVGGYNVTKKVVTHTAKGTSKTFWWPIGSAETTVNSNGKLMATGDPVPTVITSYFGAKDIAAHATGHGAIDISGPYEMGEVNIIASKSGVVVYPVDKSQTHFNSWGYEFCPDGGTYGNHVIIQHSDGTYTLYGHMAQDTILVFAGEVVEQGQVIGKMGSSGSSTGIHLHFEMRKGANSYANIVDPLDYVSIDNPRATSSYGSATNASDFSTIETVFTKEEFVAKLKDYCARSGNQAFCNNWAAHAESVYTTSVNNDINPELVVATAGREQGWGNPGGACDNNYYGIGVYNEGGCTAYSSQEEGIAAYANLLAEYRNPTSGTYNMIISRNNEREAAGCNPDGHGMPDTYSGVMSIYGWLGTYRYDPGDWSLGGCKYLNTYLYEDNYCSKVVTCKAPYQNCSEESKTTVCEQNDYTIFNVVKTTEIRYDVFGI